MNTGGGFVCMEVCICKGVYVCVSVCKCVCPHGHFTMSLKYVLCVDLYVGLMCAWLRLCTSCEFIYVYMII